MLLILVAEPQGSAVRQGVALSAGAADAGHLANPALVENLLNGFVVVLPILPRFRKNVNRDFGNRSIVLFPQEPLDFGESAVGQVDHAQVGVTQFILV